MSMRHRIGVLVHLLLWGLGILLLAAVTYLWMARPVVTGYAAKYMCSGLWVSGLPQSWLQQTAIAPALQPASDWLEYDVNEQQRRVSVGFLGLSQTAQWAAGRGCTLLNDVDNRIVALPDIATGLASEELSGSDPVSGSVSASVSEPSSASPSASSTPSSPALPASSGNRAPVPLDERQQQRIHQLLNEAFAEPDGQSRNTLAVLVSWKGQRIAERYQAPVTAETPMLGWSMTKSLLATWVGLAEQQQLLTRNSPVADLWPQVGPQLTLEHLLRMQSGLDFDEWYQPADDVTTMLYCSADMAAMVAGQRREIAPATEWRYSSGDSNLAASIWLNAVQQGDSHWRDWLQQSLWQPLGIEHATVETDLSGTPVASSYSYMTPAEWLAVGQFWLNSWHGRKTQGIGLPRSWMQQALTPTLNANAGHMYGMGFWLNLPDPTLADAGERKFSKRWPELPESVFWARGHDGQYVLVAPEQQLVVVRFGLTPGLDDGMDTLVSGLLDALTPAG